MNEITYVISSNIHYYEHTLPVILQSLRDSGVRPENILCVVGNAGTDFEYIRYDVSCIGVEYNALEFTGLIYILEQNLHLSPWYFILHDTCEVEMPFASTLRVYDIPANATHMALYDGNWSQNIGLLSDDYLYNVKRDFILEHKNKTKDYMIQHEDRIFDNKSEWYFHSKIEGNEKFIGSYDSTPIDRYGTGVLRERHYWDRLHLIKWRSHHNQGRGNASNGASESP